MKREKGVYFIVAFTLLFLVSSSIIYAATTNNTNNLTSTNSFEKSYTCLTNLVNSKISAGMTTEELAFSILALGYDSTMQNKLKAELDELGKDGKCWPKSGCTLKETSLVLLAYNHINANTNEIESWLLNQTMNPTELVWYLQIDSDSSGKAQCKIKYDNTERGITINEDKTLTGTPGTCLTLANGGIWLEISPSCYGKEFEISCDKDFLSNTIYKKKSSSTFYISALTNTAATGGKTTEKVESSCFKQGSSCNYEGSLWASLALQKTGNDIKKVIPYLLTLAADNKRYNPSAFLYVLTVGFDEYFTELINDQTKEGYWQLSDTSKRYYDTAMSMLALGSSIEASMNAKDYLLNSKVQGEGCYNNNIRDTAFVVYAAAPKNAATPSAVKSCTSSGYSCLTKAQCDESNGSVLGDYSCLGLNVCCTEKYTEKSCSQRNGKACLSTQDCSGTWASGLSNCCLSGDCVAKQETDQCSVNGAEYKCKSQCLSDEIEESYSCPESGVCCFKEQIEDSEGSLWWLWLLIILIILLVLAIIFRNQLKIWLFKIKSKFSKQPVNQQQRPFPSQPMPNQMAMPRRIVPGAMNRMPPRPLQRPFPKDKELEETLKKLRDMGK